jgi:uncharacterized protein (TIGR00255 family)
VVVEIRALNHRYLEVRAHVPHDLSFLGPVCDLFLRRRLERGAIDVRVYAEGAVFARVTVDRERARSAYAALAALADEVAKGTPVPVDAVLRVPDVFVPVAAQAREALERATENALDAALADLHRMQEKEGASLVADLAARASHLRSLSGEVAARQPEAAKERKERLRRRIAELLDEKELGADPASRPARPGGVDDDRIEREIALAALRFDTAEEATRLTSHLEHFEGILAEGGAVGKRLDFLLQEIAREVNTMGAKSEDVRIAHAIVDMKAEASKMREQVQNVL